ncbi:MULTISPECIES: hypothetical protein [Sphingomonadaceae]|uniref:Uncharacterized protein n=1 Tax=Sphingomonas bisphenolicum TaxID=296544 RepID=A0ABM7FYD8_9SPHN|nr:MULTISPECIES: hypothetical protein [Sphingomonadaceae]MBA4092179.1 hypothetical protein [Sphingobium sp.]MBZ9649154.1 hypothetical protein [Sphingobium sp. 3R8]BBF67931.1 hypothetical protein SBA_ch1_01310 [Sphingomonas bisphenolicum]
MVDWHPRPAAQIGLRLLGLALIASLALQGAALRALIRQSDLVTPVQLLLAATCFASASLGAALLLLGPDLWKPVAISPRWHGHAADARK